MNSRDDEIEMTIEPEEPTRPAWLFNDATDVIDEPAAGGPYDPPPSMVIPPSAASRATSPSMARAALVGALAGAVVASLVSFGIVNATDDDRTQERGALGSPVAVANGQGLDVHAVLAAVEDAVVAINVEGEGALGRSRGAGSGMIIDAEGLVLTNNHVIADATSISVTLGDGREIGRAHV